MSLFSLLKVRITHPLDSPNQLIPFRPTIHPSQQPRSRDSRQPNHLVGHPPRILYQPSTSLDRTPSLLSAYKCKRPTQYPSTFSKTTFSKFDNGNSITSLLGKSYYRPCTHSPSYRPSTSCCLTHPRLPRSPYLPGLPCSFPSDSRNYDPRPTYGIPSRLSPFNICPFSPLFCPRNIQTCLRSHIIPSAAPNSPLGCNFKHSSTKTYDCAFQWFFDGPLQPTLALARI